MRPHGWFIGAGGLLRPIWRSVLFLILALLLLQLVIAAAHSITRGWPGAAGPAPYYVYIALNAALLLETWFLLSVFDRRSFRAAGLWCYFGSGRELLAGAGIGAGLMAAVIGVMAGTHVAVYHGLAAAGPRATVQLAGLAALLFLAAAFEEIAFRGYGFQRLVDSLGPLGAVAVFSALFGIVHLRNPSATPLSTANTILSGVLLSAAYLKTRALWLPIGLHWAWNFFQGPIFAMPVSGLTPGTPLLRVAVSGPTWLTGGDYGPEGSVVLTVWCVVATVWLACTQRISVSEAMREVLK